MVESQAGAKGSFARRAWRGMLTAVAVTAITLGLFALIEGLAGTFLVAWEVTRVSSPGLQSRQHSVHDTLLGWLNTPGFRNHEMYGTGRDLVINSSSFRDDSETPMSEPGVLRIFCSGDSFTFGVGVGNDDTWCAQLERRDGRIRTVNLAHAGYGIDQAYLRYRRDGESLEHAVHILAFIPDDVRRVRLARFAGYNKPHFSVDNGVLELQNVPVPELSKMGAFAMRSGELLNRLHIVQFADRFSDRFFQDAREERPNTDAEARAITVELMDSLNASAIRHDRIMLFVLLPQTLNGSRQYDELAAELAAEAANRGLPFLDFRKELRRTLPADSLGAMFDPMASGHYSVRGNQRVADGLWRVLGGMPDFERRLNATVRLTAAWPGTAR